MGRPYSCYLLLIILIFPVVAYVKFSPRNIQFGHDLSDKSVAGLSKASHCFQLSPKSGKRLEDIAEPLLDYDLIQRTIQEWTAPLPTSAILTPFVIVGPSGVGKGRLIRALLKDYTRFFKKVVTHTCRSHRQDEVNGTNYHFITREEFLEKKSQGYFLEHATVHENLYGISYDEWKSVQKSSKIAILEIDIQGARTIKSMAKSLGITPKFLFIAPMNMSMLHERLTHRGSEVSSEISLRLATAVREMEECREPGLFDEILVNDDIAVTINALFRVVRKWYPSLPSAARMQMLRRRLKNIKAMAQQQTESETESEVFSTLPMSPSDRVTTGTNDNSGTKN
eukprot:gene2977-5840_t